MGEVQVSRGEGPRRRRQFDEAFKRDAVRLVETGNSSVRKVAEDLGISKAGARASPAHQNAVNHRLHRQRCPFSFGVRPRAIIWPHPCSIAWPLTRKALSGA